MESSTRVLILGQNYAPEPSGNAPYTTSLAEGLVARGLQVRVIAAQPYYPDWRVAEGFDHWATSDRQRGVRVDRKRHYVPRRLTAVKRLLSELSFGIRSVCARWGRPDVILLVSPSLFAVAVAMLRLKACRLQSVIWVQDLYSLGVVETGQGGHALGSAMRGFESAVLRRATSVVAIHDRFRRHAVEELQCDSERVSIVRNWSHLPTVRVVDRRAVRARMGWAEDETVVLHAGNMGVKQGLENVVEAARLAGTRGSSVRFVLVGGGNQREVLRALGRDVAPLEFIDSLPDDAFQDVLGAADILLVNEKPGVAGMSVPSKLTSYMSTGLPVLASTDAGSVTDTEVRASGSGVSVAAGSAEELLAAAEDLGSDPGRRRRLGASGQLFREDHYDQERAIDRYAQLLEEVAGRRRRSR